MTLKGLGLVEFLVAPLAESQPDPDLLQRLSDLIRAGGIRVLDFVLSTSSPHGGVSWSDVDVEEFALAGIELVTSGLIAEEDIRDVLTIVPAGSWAIVLVEHTWSFPDSRFRHPGATVRSVARIPPSIVEFALRDA